MTPREELDIRRRIAAAQSAGDARAELEARRALAGAQGGSQGAPQPSLAQPAFDAAAGVNRGLMGTLDMVAGNPVAGIANTLGADIGYNPITRAAQSVGIGQPSTAPTGKFLGRVGEEVGAAILPGAGILRAAPMVKSGLLAPLVQQAAVNPAGFAAAELGSAAASGTGAAIANEVAPGSVAAEMTGQMAGALAPTVAAGALRGLMGVNPAQVATMQRAGVDPTVGQTGNTAARVLEGTLKATPGSTGLMGDIAERQAGQLQTRADDIVRRMASDVSEESAGRAIESGFKGFVNRSQTKAGELWSALDDVIAGPTPVAMGSTRRVLNELTGKGALSKVFANPTIGRAAKAVQEAGDTVPYEELRELRSFIGGRLGSSDLISDIPRADLKRLYGALSQDIRAAAEDAGALQQFERANNYTRGLHTRVEDTLEPILRRATPEKIFRAVRGSDASTLRGIKRSLKPQEWQKVVGMVVDDLGTAVPSRQGATGEVFSPETFLTKWNKLKPEVRRQLFTGPGFATYEQDIKALADAAELMRRNAETLSNASGTARLGLHGAALIGAPGIVYGSPTASAAVFGGMGLANVTARMMSNPKVVNWLARSTRVKPDRLPSMISRLSQTVANEPDAIRADVDAFISGMTQ